MKYIKPAYPTSRFFPEDYVNTGHWGAIPEKGLLPLQVKTIPLSGRPFSSYHGMKSVDIHRFNMERECNMFFQPNPLVTRLKDSPGIKDKRVLAVPSTPATLHTTYVDIDHTSDLEAVLKIAPVKPQVAVSSGRGLHLYFGIAPVHLASMTGNLEEDRLFHLETFKMVQMRLCDIFNGDPSTCNKFTQAMRIPGTLNYKVERGEIVRRDCSILMGDILDIYRSPQYELFSLAKKLSLKPFTMTSAQSISFIKKHSPLTPEKRPKPFYDGWEEAHCKIVRACNFDKKQAGRKSFCKFFKFLYGYRKLDYYLECPDDSGKYLSGLRHDSHTKWRDLFIKTQLVEKISDGDIFQRRASKYVLTDKFYEIIGEKSPREARQSRISSSPKKSLSFLMDQIKPEDYPPHQLRQRIIPHYKALRNAGMSEEEVESFFMDRLSMRERFDPEDNLALLRHIAENFKPFPVRKPPLNPVDQVAGQIT